MLEYQGVELDKEGEVDGGDEDLQEDAIDEVPEEGRGKKQEPKIISLALIMGGM